MAALIALMIYCLACIYPAAWSPDSKKVVLPVWRLGPRMSNQVSREAAGLPGLSRGLFLVGHVGQVRRVGLLFMSPDT